MSINMQSENSLRLLWGRYDMSPFINSLNPSTLVVNSLSELPNLLTEGIDEKEIILIRRKGQVITGEQNDGIASLLAQNKLVKIFEAEIVYSRSASELKTLLDLVSYGTLIFIVCDYTISQVIKENYNSHRSLIFFLDEAV
jgi:hypothetical protein